MPLLRVVLAVLLTVAVAVAPVGAVMAQSSQGTSMVGMEDCAKEMPAGECPCCDSKSQCPASVCLLKCFKLVGETPALVTMPSVRFGQIDPVDPVKPPDQLLEPQPPPPRA